MDLIYKQEYHKDNIKDYFVPDVELVTYKNLKECTDKIEMLLKDDELRNRISRAGQKRTLQDHTMRSRTENWLTTYLKIILFDCL